MAFTSTNTRPINRHLLHLGVRMAIVERVRKDGTKSYFAVVRVNGKRSWVWCGDKPRLAKEIHDELTVKARNHQLPTMRDIRFSTLTDKFFADGCHDRRSSTIAAYRSRTRNHLTPFFGDLKVRKSVTTEAIQSWISHEKRQGSSDASIRSALTTLSAILSYAVDINLLVDNPCRRVRSLKVVHGGVDMVLSPSQVKALINATPVRNGDRVLMKFLAMTGCRPSEAVETRWRDVSFRTNEVVISRTATKTGDKTSPTKTGKVRTVPLTLSLVLALGDWKKQTNGSGDDLVFPAVRGGRRDPQRFAAEVFRPALTRAGLMVPEGSRSLYLLRKSLASNLLQAGESVKLVSSILGQSEAVCLRHYARVRTEDASAAMQRMDAMMDAEERDTTGNIAHIA